MIWVLRSCRLLQLIYTLECKEKENNLLHLVCHSRALANNKLKLGYVVIFDRKKDKPQADARATLRQVRTRRHPVFVAVQVGDPACQ